MTQSREAGISRSRFYELRTRYWRYREAGLRSTPRPAAPPDRRAWMSRRRMVIVGLWLALPATWLTTLAMETGVSGTGGRHHR